jgi:glycine/D-amino acid oxidase-like deaminating enzyme
MNTDYLIIGQGICGTFLSWYFTKAGISCVVMDQQQPGTASVTAAGVINPVTGRRLVTTWLIDEVLPFAQEAYTALGQELGLTIIKQQNIIDFFPTAQMRQAFLERHASGTAYVALPADENNWREYFHYELGYGIIQPCYLIDLPAMLPAYRRYLQQRQLLREERFDHQQLQLAADHIQYGDITARAIIFCDGIAATTNPWFGNLPFAPNKGEMLLIEAPDLPATHIFKRGISLVPWQPGIFWAGSTYEWAFAHPHPTAAFRERTEAALRNWLRVPFTVIDHRAAVRPATLERRPFVGFHPLQPQVGIFNGMGTKGCSLGPFFAKQLVEHILKGTPLQKEADVRRFEKILARKLENENN